MLKSLGLSFLLTFVCALDGSLSSSSFSPRIIGGVNASPYQFPWMTRIITPLGGLCGGTLVAPDKVLTAAHCCTCQNSSQAFTDGFRLDINLYQFNTPDACTNTRRAISRRCHPDFTPNRPDHDFCLITLNTPSSYPVPLLYDSRDTQKFEADTDYDAEGATVLVIGFGVNARPQNTLPPVLQKVFIPIANVSQCLANYTAVQTLTFDPNYVLCGSTLERKDACLGDSGGPMFNRLNDGSAYVLVGVTSTGAVECADPDFSGVYSKINTPSFFDFFYGPPTSQPTSSPSRSPTRQPTLKPTLAPTFRPTPAPTDRPTTKQPTGKPTRSPTGQPTLRPSTTRPTARPTTTRPTRFPTLQPTTKTPTSKPTPQPPTGKGTTKSPTLRPTRLPTRFPTTRSPTRVPTKRPTKEPTDRPTRLPTRAPTTRKPTFFPTRKPTISPTTRVPTQSPTTKSPTLRPTTIAPTAPTRQPTTRAPTNPAACVSNAPP